MKKRTAALCLAITIVLGVEANGRDPFDSDWQPFPPPVEPQADPVAFVVPAGIYFVTDTYVGDVAATVDTTTTYSTSTVHESTGTYARVVDTVGTGSSSLFDGAAFNGRGALTDGRALAGTYYENFVLTADGYVPVSIVFFQDDSETRRRAQASSPSPAATASVATSAPTTGAATSRRDFVPAPSFRPEITNAPAAAALRAGVALAYDGPTLAAAEVLRGRLVEFWPRAFANNVAVPIRSWRLLSAQPDRTSASSGSGEPLVAQWIQMPAPGVRWSLRFEIFTDVAPNERLEAQIVVTVRSPAVVD